MEINIPNTPDKFAEWLLPIVRRIGSIKNTDKIIFTTVDAPNKFMLYVPTTGNVVYCQLYSKYWRIFNSDTVSSGFIQLSLEKPIDSDNFEGKLSHRIKSQLKNNKKINEVFVVGAAGQFKTDEGDVYKVGEHDIYVFMRNYGQYTILNATDRSQSPEEKEKIKDVIHDIIDASKQ